MRVLRIRDFLKALVMRAIFFLLLFLLTTDSREDDPVSLIIIRIIVILALLSGQRAICYNCNDCSCH